MLQLKLGFIFFIIFYFSNKIAVSTLSSVEKYLWITSMTKHADYPTKTVIFAFIMIIGMIVSVLTMLYGIYIL